MVSARDCLTLGAFVLFWNSILFWRGVVEAVEMDGTSFQL